MAMYKVSYSGLDEKHSDRYMAKDRSELHMAASRGQLMDLHTYIRHGYSVNKRTNMGYTPLHDACWTNHPYCASHLVKAGAQIDAMSSDGKTPLALASSSGSKDCVKLLLDAGSKVNVEDESCSSPLHAAAIAGHVECVDLLLESGGGVNGNNPYYGSPLHAACGASSMECTASLIASGANVNAVRQRDLQTPLHVAGSLNCLSVVELLVCNGADVHGRDKNGKKPVDLALTDGATHSHLETAMTNPEALMSICRNQIRTSLGSSIPNGHIQKLELPKSLQEFITYTDTSSLSSSTASL